MTTHLEKVLMVKIIEGCESRVTALNQIRIDIECSSPWDVATRFGVLENNSAEEFMIQYMTAYNEEVTHIY
jgi:hypothetical protein